MNQKLQNILDIIQQSEKLDTEQKENMIKAIKDADKELEITAFKLERTEKVKKTTAILLEETIEELEQKRKAVEAQNRELEIEASLERVRTVAMGMNKSDDLLNICEVSFKEFKKLGFDNLRNAIINILNDEKGFFLDYDYSDYLGGSITNINYNSHPVVEDYLRQIKRTDDAFAQVVIEGTELDGWKEFRRSGGQVDDPKLDETQSLYYYLFSIGVGDIGISTFSPIDDTQLKIMKRFRNVFDLAYRRYNDITLAEIQARESQIELALERVRARTMAMQKPEELVEVAELLRKEMGHLGVEELETSSIYIVNKENQQAECWYAIKDIREENKRLVSDEMTVTLSDTWVGNEMWKFYRSKKEQTSIVMKGDNRKEWINYCADKSQVLQGYYGNEIPERTYHLVKFNGGYMGAASPKDISSESWGLLKRAAAVFSLAYTRFKDLQDAAARAREAQIELALERVRARTMGMQKSEELKEVIQVVYEQFVQLNIHIEHTGFIIDFKARDDMHIWLADKHEVPTEITIPYFDSPHWNSFNEAKEKGMDFFANHLTFEEKNKFYKDLFKLIPGVPEETVEYYLSCPGLAISTVLLENVGLYIENFSGIPYSDEENNTLMRFGKVFQQTYTRFLDLQKVEAQSRESQIELALERVRARTMAMHKSEELLEVITVVSEQLKHLGFRFDHVSFAVNNQVHDYNFWISFFDHPHPHNIFVPYLDNPMFERAKQAQQEGLSFYSDVLTPVESRQWHKHVFEHNNFDFINEKLKQYIYKSGFARSIAFLPHIMLIIGNYASRSYSEEENKIISRFAMVFDQSYTRFLDLQKAEAQVREAQIEGSLEKVRGSAMAMHSSNDISSTTTIVFEELKKLNIKSKRCGVALLSGNSFMGHVYAAATSSEGKFLTLRRSIDMTQHQSLQQQYESWKKQENYFIEMNGDELKSYYQLPFFYSSPDYVPPANYERTEYGYYIPFSEGLFYAWTEEPYSESEINILNRFKKIVDLTFRRYLDLKKAEAQTKEAIKQASLDRVRGEIASMRTSEDLNRITPVIWRELKTLEVPFIRCGVFIVNEDKENVQVYLTTPDGKSLGVLNLSFDTNELTSTTVEHWRKKLVYKEHWNKEEFINWTRSMIEIGQVQNAETYQGSTTPPESLDLHFVPFTQGMLYVGNVSPLMEEKIALVKTLADAFSIAYARYEDFRNLEEAKNKIELTLKELKSAQVQLIHSEKMASLGELTAGIAHEIKNPLNFVNNFSEISGELLDEMKTELENKNIEEVIELIENLKQNLEKINQHGKRADSIVKGMLLHSRGSSGEKTLTDINDLLDQYVNLAYHGMRAQNKEFNISIEKDYDKTLEKLNVIPQDISRVFLNIINNACYAANEKKKKSSDFVPILKVSTKKLQDKVEIRIRDNGNGIPKDILDKIFQPFFTTKPTGEGTGLGLSLSYDIITKVHDGELKVETNEREGTVFIISIPGS